MRIDAIVNLAQQAHRQHWTDTGNASRGVFGATKVTEVWQQACVAAFGRAVQPEFAIGDHLSKRIDLVDVEELTAYELKVSPKNAHFELYKDIFKVIIARDNMLKGLNKFIFIAPSAGLKVVNNAFTRSVVAHGESIGLSIQLRGI
jgi:hypothetical protein